MDLTLYSYNLSAYLYYIIATFNKLKILNFMTDKKNSTIKTKTK